MARRRGAAGGPGLVSPPARQLASAPDGARTLALLRVGARRTPASRPPRGSREHTLLRLANRIIRAARVAFACRHDVSVTDPSVAFVLDIREHPHAFLLACALAALDGATDTVALTVGLHERLGHLDPRRLAELTAGQLAAATAWPEGLHADPAGVASVVSSVTRGVVSRYGGDAAAVWFDRPSSATLLRRLVELGIGRDVAVAAAGVLVRDLGVVLEDYRSLDLDVHAGTMRVLARLGFVAAAAGPDAGVYLARELAPDFPASIEPVLDEIGREYCHERDPRCGACPYSDLCEFASATRAVGRRFPAADR